MGQGTMKFLLAAINAKYIHSNPAVYSLRAYAREKVPGADIEIGEYTINHQMEQILQDIYRRKPDFVGFSCYIWNISYIYELVRDIHKVLPRAEIWLGGPEVSYDAAKVLEQEPDVRGVMRGEGELTFSQVVEAYEAAAGDRRQAEDAGEDEQARGAGRAERNERAEGDGNTGQAENAVQVRNVGQPENFVAGSAGQIRGVGQACGPRDDILIPMLQKIRGITFRMSRVNAGDICETPPQRLLPMDEIPFYYSDMSGFENRIVYYESSRGCPFSCSYCLSSIDKSVRFRSLDLVKKELDFFLDHKVPQVKFIDRTFNCKREHTLGIWRHILENDNGITNFHFEVSADLFDDEELSVIENMRPGLIQLEIGVQSTNPDTITEIRRRMDLTRLKAAVDRVHSFRNTHQHLDLIAGLPFEGIESFYRSFDDVYRMKPDQLQLGFLKVLKGSYMAEQAEQYELQYRAVPPYEVLSTRWLPFEEVIRLKGVEDMVEVHYNSGQFKNTLALLEQEFTSPSAMFRAMADYYEQQGLFGLNHSRMARYEIFYDFLKKQFAGDEARLSKFRDSLVTDLYLRENAKSRPSFAMDQAPFKDQIRSFFAGEETKERWLPGYDGYDSRQISKMAHMEAMEDGSFILFDYRNRDRLDNNARAIRFSYTERGKYGKEGDEDGQGEAGKRDSFAAGCGIWNRLPLLSES